MFEEDLLSDANLGAMDAVRQDAGIYPGSSRNNGEHTLHHQDH